MLAYTNFYFYIRLCSVSSLSVRFICLGTCRGSSTRYIRQCSSVLIHSSFSLWPTDGPHRPCPSMSFPITNSTSHRTPDPTVPFPSPKSERRWWLNWDVRLSSPNWIDTNYRTTGSELV